MSNTVSRTKKTIINATASLLQKAIVVGLKFVSQYVFIYTLGRVYLGVGALFGSIITLLSLADLGFGIALPQSLYDPLAKGDHPQIRRLISFYGKVYRVIAIAILGIGAAFLPFLPYIVGKENMGSIDHLYVVYFLFVVQSSVSYLFVYKRNIFTADQKNYYISAVECLTLIVTSVLQITTLLIFKNYILYLLIAIITTIIQNFIISYICDKYYPYLKNLSRNETLSKTEKKNLSKKIYSLFIYRLASAVETGTDNLILNATVGLVLTGLVSNYILITSSLAGILIMIMSAAIASIGNLIVTESREKTFEVYNLLDFLGFWVYGCVGICIVTLAEPFIVLWLGKDYLIEFSALAVLGANFYISGVQNVNSNFRNAYGLFYEGRYRPIAMVLVNVIASLILVRFWGITGVFIGTLLSRLLTVGIFDPYIVFKYGLNKPLRFYYFKHGIYHITVGVVGTVIYCFFNMWSTASFGGWIIKAIAVFVVVNIIFFLMYARTDVFRETIRRVRGIVKSKSNS